MWLELVNLVTLMESLATWNRTRIGNDINSAVTLCTIWVLPPVFTWRKGEGRGGGKRRVGRQVPLTANALDSGSRDRGSNTGISLNISAYHASAHSRVYFSNSEGTVRKTADKFLRGGVGEIPSPMSFHRHLPTSRY